MPAMPTRWGRTAATLLLALLAAELCVWAGTPLPWMIGPLLATAAAGATGLPVQAPAVLRHVGQWLIGIVLGLYFTPQVVGIVAAHTLAIVVGIGWALLLGLGFGAFLRRANRRLAPDDATVFFAGAIGGASEMAVLAERHGGRIDLVAAAHSTRILIVVLTIPFGLQITGLHGLDSSLPGPRVVNAAGLAILLPATLAGAWLLRRGNLPNAWMLGSMAVALGFTASGVELSALPVWASHVAQLFIGVSLGTRFTPQFVHTAPRWLASVAFGTLVMMALCAGFAWMMAAAADFHPATLLLATSPGGIAEMCITAAVLQLGVPIVTAFHATRLVAVLLLAQPLFRLFRRRKAFPARSPQR